MRFSESARRRVSLLAVFVFLFGMLLPMLGSAAHGERSHTLWLDVCGPEDMAPLAVSFETSEGEAHSSQHDGHCVLCFSPATGAAPMGVLPPLRVAASVFRPMGDDVAPPSGRVWNPALARAPPVLS